MPSYFDHNATTPVEPRVLSTFVEVAGEIYGNASSIHHFGQLAKQRLESSRRSVGRLLGASPRDIVFTSGGTEADNLAIFGAVRASSRARKHVITSAIEHPAVLAACNQLVREGVALSVLPVGASCQVDPQDVRNSLRPETILVSVMHANNETGAIQPLAEISEITQEAGVLFHADGVQAAARLTVDMDQLGVDLYSVSAHKMNAPKGAGALYIRDRTPLRPVQFGGHQERERRGGTENIPAIAAFGVSADLSANNRIDSTLRDRLEQGILAALPHASLHARGPARLPNTTNIGFPGVSGEAMVIALDLAGFAVSSGAACASGSIEPSHVLLAMGISETEARSSVRFSLGLGNTAQEVDRLIEAVAEAAQRLAIRRPARAVAHV